MQTSQVKKGNPVRRGKTALRKHRLNKEAQRLEEAGLPTTPLHIHPCPTCGTGNVKVLKGKTRMRKSVRISECCYSALTDEVIKNRGYHPPPPPKKKGKRRRDEDD